MKTLRLAVVGPPVSGKTYLLSDLIHSLTAMGYEPLTLPLDYPYSSFGSFFYEVSNFDANTRHHHSFKGTENYAARQENRYGALLRHPRSRHTLAIDFLNIPGEVFQDGSHATQRGSQQRLKLFFRLRHAIGRTGRLFSIVTYTNPAGRTIRIVEPHPDVYTRLGRRHDTTPTALATHRSLIYMQWGEIYAELQAGRYTRQPHPIAADGKYLLDHFFQFLPDAFLLTLRALWPLITGKDHLRLDDYEAHGVLSHFYFMEYTRQATDVIICDRLYAHDADAERTLDLNIPTHQQQPDASPYAFNFEDLTETLAHYYTPHSTPRPNVYLAFRCADLVMRQPTTQQALAQAARSAATPHERRQAPYDLFVSSLMAHLQSPEPATPPCGIDNDVSTRPTAIGARLEDHLRTRLGRDASHAFCRLLRLSAPTPSILHPSTWTATLRRRLRRQPTPRPDFNPRQALPPQVYFTASPIDLDFRVYVNDPDDTTQFVHRDPDGRLRSFHIETTVADRPAMCFGAYQLMRDLFRFNGIS